MPVQLFGNIRLVVNVHRDALAFTKTKQRTRKLPVERRRRNKLVLAAFNQPIANMQGVVGLRAGIFSRALLRRKPRQWKQRRSSRGACSFQEFTTIDHKGAFRIPLRSWLAETTITERRNACRHRLSIGVHGESPRSEPSPGETLVEAVTSD